MYDTKMLSKEKDLNSKILIQYYFNGWRTIRTGYLFSGAEKERTCGSSL
jgi:hypothetical protein